MEEAITEAGVDAGLRSGRRRRRVALMVEAQRLAALADVPRR